MSARINILTVILFSSSLPVALGTEGTTDAIQKVDTAAAIIQRNYRIKKLKQAHQPENIERIYQYGLHFRNGDIRAFPKSSSQSIENAKFYFKAAANYSHFKAQHNLAAIMCNAGEFEQAYAWLFRAARFSRGGEEKGRCERKGLEASSRNLEALLEQGYFNPDTLKLEYLFGRFDDLTFTAEEASALKSSLLEKYYKENLESVKKTLERWPPSCFFSYAWGKDKDTDCVRKLAKDVKESGVNVIIDTWDNTGGTFISRFTENIGQATYVILAGSINLMSKWRNEHSGAVVNLEITQIFEVLKTRPGSVIPILLDGDVNTSLPSFLRDVVYIDFSSEVNYFSQVFALLRCLLPRNEAINNAAIHFFEKAEHLSSEEFNRKEIKVHLVRQRALLKRKKETDRKTSEAASTRVLNSIETSTRSREVIDKMVKTVKAQLSALQEDFHARSSQLTYTTERYLQENQSLKQQMQSVLSKQALFSDQMVLVDHMYRRVIGKLMFSQEALKDENETRVLAVVARHNLLKRSLKKEKESLLQQQAKEIEKEIVDIQLRYLRCLGFEVEDVDIYLSKESPKLLDATKEEMKKLLDFKDGARGNAFHGLIKSAEDYEGMLDSVDLPLFVTRLNNLMSTIQRECITNMELRKRMESLPCYLNKEDMTVNFLKPLLASAKEALPVALGAVMQNPDKPAMSPKARAEIGKMWSTLLRLYIKLLDVDVKGIINMEQLIERLEGKLKWILDPTAIPTGSAAVVKLPSKDKEEDVKALGEERELSIEQKISIYQYTSTDINRLLHIPLSQGLPEGTVYGRFSLSGGQTRDDADTNDIVHCFNNSRYVLPPIIRHMEGHEDKSPYETLLDFFTDSFFVHPVIQEHPPEEMIIPFNPGGHWVTLQIFTPPVDNITFRYIDSVAEYKMATPNNNVRMLLAFLRGKYLRKIANFESLLFRRQPDGVSCGAIAVENVKDLFRQVTLPTTERLVSTAEMLALKTGHRDYLVERGFDFDFDFD